MWRILNKNYLLKICISYFNYERFENKFILFDVFVATSKM